MAFAGLLGTGKDVKKVRDNSSNKSLATIVARRASTLLNRASGVPRTSTTPSSQLALTSELNDVVADLNNAIDNDPPEGNMYDLVGHVKTTAALKDTNNRLDMIEAQLGQLQRQQTTSSQAEQVMSPTSLGESGASSPTVTTPPVAPTAADTQRAPPRRQGSIPLPRRRETQPPASPKDAEIISGLDAVAESAAKDDKRLIKRLVKLMEELNKTVQGAELEFDLAHNAEGGTIRMPDDSHDQAIHRAVGELLGGAYSSELRRFQETSVRVNQIITKIRDKMNLPKTCRVQLYELDKPNDRYWVCVLPDNVKTMNELIIHLLEEKKFDEEEEGAICIFLRKHEAHQLTPKGRLWELADGDLNLRFPGTEMDNIECEDGAFVLDWVVNDKDFAIALMDNGIEETGSILDLPQRSKKTNKCVREHLRVCLPKHLSDYEIDHIRDIGKPNDDTVADKPFHKGNFAPTKHSLVVKLRKHCG